MLFNSFDFALFLPVVFALHWLLGRNKNYQNTILLAASYFFYACWDFRFLFLLVFSTSLDYFTGLKIYDAKNSAGKKTWLWISIIINLGFLAVFKYYNFFVESLTESLAYLGVVPDFVTIHVILPVGISFYTFHGLSYVLDIYNGRIQPERNVVDYSLFVSFFPLLVAGPIERATHLLPQLKIRRQFTYEKGAEGMRLILWGLFKKIVIADNCAIYVNQIFSNYETAGGIELILGAILFAFQIYGDFSGYSDIAIGTAKLFGVELLVNFKTPYFSRDIAEFWRRWHISLSSWFRDYVYFPLGGSRVNKATAVRNTFIIFLLSGLWHGANWTFIMWGLLNALYFLPLLLFDRNRKNVNSIAEGRLLPDIRDLSAIVFTFAMTCLAWIFFRADSIGMAFQYITNIFSHSFFTLTTALPPMFLLLNLSILVLVDWITRDNGINVMTLKIKLAPVRYSLYFLFVVLIGLFGAFNETEFIYFQF